MSNLCTDLGAKLTAPCQKLVAKIIPPIQKILGGIVGFVMKMLKCTTTDVHVNELAGL